MSHQELKIAPGVYITDFRKGGQLTGIQEVKNELTNDVGLLIDGCKNIESKWNKLQQSIQMIKQQQNWQNEPDYMEAIEDNLRVMLRFSQQLKQKILLLFQLKYQPQSQQMEKIMNIDRVQMRQKQIRIQLQVFDKDRKQCQVNSDNEQQKGIYL